MRAILAVLVLLPLLPVSIPGIAPLGAGLERAAGDFKLKDSTAGQEERFRNVFQIIEQAIAEKAFPGAALAVGYKGELVALREFGKFDYSPDAPAVTTDTIYDLASVTKALGTATAAAILYEQGKLPLNAPLVRYLPEFGGAPHHSRITVRHLLKHNSGLPPDGKLFKEAPERPALLQRIYSMPLLARPGRRYVYSDLGMIALGQAIERVAGQPLDQFLRERVFEPLEMKDTFYNPPRELLPRIAPTEQDEALRKRLVRGEVHDENAWVLGGVAGHAGLFSMARDLAAFAQMMLNGGAYRGRRILKRRTVQLFTARRSGPLALRHALGWETRGACALSTECRWAGAYISSRWFGHTGFTGTSLWIDPEKQLFVALLSNRVHPTRENQQIHKVRPAVHDAVVEALQAQ